MSLLVDMVHLPPLISWSVNLEGGHWWYAHIVELPGCFTRGASREEVVSLLQSAVEERIRWLRERGFDYPMLSGFKVIEEQHDIPELGESGGVVALFKSDMEPLDESATSEAIKLMTFHRKELLETVGELTKDELDIISILGKRNVRQDICHIINAEEWYVSRLGLRYQKIYEENLRKVTGSRRLAAVERLQLTRPAMITALELALTNGHQGPFKRRAYTDHPEELWTLRKVFRRFLEHEREHLGTIRVVLDAMGK
jgi:predicted RNase H-like HicB family nuclease